MLLNPNPDDYLPLLGINSKPSLFLGPRRSGAGGNAALYKAVQKVFNKESINSDRTMERMWSYLRTGGNPKFGNVKIPENWATKVSEILRQLPNEIDELWTVSLASWEAGANAVVPDPSYLIEFTRMKLWCPYLSSGKIWRQNMRQANDWKYFIELVRELEFSQTKNIEIALYLLSEASTEDQTKYPMYLLRVSTLLFVAACADADLDFAEGQSVFEFFLPRAEGGKIEPPLRRWMKYMQKTLGVETKQEVTDILLSHQSEGSSRYREGKKLWSLGGSIDAEGSEEKVLYLPSSKQFSKMTDAAFKYLEKHNSENVEYANSLRIGCVFVTFLSNLYAELDDLSSNERRMMLFEDYKYFYKVAKNTEGPPPRLLGGG